MQITSGISDVGYPVTHQLWVEIMAESARNSELQKKYISSYIIMRQSLAGILTLRKSRLFFLPLSTA